VAATVAARAAVGVRAVVEEEKVVAAEKAAAEEERAAATAEVAATAAVEGWRARAAATAALVVKVAQGVDWEVVAAVVTVRALRKHPYHTTHHALPSVTRVNHTQRRDLHWAQLLSREGRTWGRW
jgi:hypothetical protein